jgi:hypothetical protein
VQALSQATPKELILAGQLPNRPDECALFLMTATGSGAAPMDGICMLAPTPALHGG